METKRTKMFNKNLCIPGKFHNYQKKKWNASEIALQAEQKNSRKKVKRSSFFVSVILPDEKIH